MPKTLARDQASGNRTGDNKGSLGFVIPSPRSSRARNLHLKLRDENVCDPRWFSRLQPLSRSFYNRDPRIVARALLGKILIRENAPARAGNKTKPRETKPRDPEATFRAGRIVETEAYLGAGDAAAHAAAGLTQRNAVLFGPPGHAYVYLSYGLHYCLNVSCLPAGRAGCVLIRALEPLAGVAAMARARKLLKVAALGAPFKPGFGLSGEVPRLPFLKAAKSETPERVTQNLHQLRLLCSGPARLCQAFEIARARDNGDDLTRASAGSLWIADDGFRPRRISTSARVGITKSVELDLRYYVADSSYVSR